MNCAKLENNIVTNVVYFDPTMGYSPEFLQQNNLIIIDGFPVTFGDIYSPEEKRFYRENEPIYSSEEQLQRALNVLLAGVEE